MARTDSPSWWADVQQDRDDLGGRRPAEEWLDEDVEFIPRRRFPRSVQLDRGTADHPLHGVFVHAESEPRDVRSAQVSSAGAPAPRADARRTVHITGRPDERRSLTPSRRHRPRTASDRVGHRPDRIALWAVLLGVVLIILAFSSSNSHAATHVATHAAALANLLG
jgi:hypothetical protein